MSLPESIGLGNYVPAFEGDLEIATLLLLPHLIKGGFKLKVNEGRAKKYSHKVSGKDSSDCFVRFLKVHYSLNDFAEIEVLPFQPFLICMGDLSKMKFDHAFFMIERRYVESANFLKSVDVCFKSYLLFHVTFPTECRQEWNFLGNTVYGLVSDNSLTSTGLALRDLS